eukprot:32699_4
MLRRMWIQPCRGGFSVYFMCLYGVPCLLHLLRADNRACCFCFVAFLSLCVAASASGSELDWTKVLCCLAPFFFLFLTSAFFS